MPPAPRPSTKDGLTCRLVSQTLSDLSLGSEVQVPALGLAGLVLQGEGEDGIGLLDGVLARGFSVESGVDHIKGLGGGECSWWKSK